MSKSYADIIQQIEDLQAEAARIKNAEVDGVIARIKEAIAVYKLTPSDLGFGGKPGPKPGKPGRKPGRPAGSKNIVKTGAKPGRKPGRPAGSAAPGKAATFTKSKINSVAKFRDANGNSWVGRGPRPQWLRDALNSGKSLKDFAV
jgi:DNA-binding protein H-NS